MPPKKVVCKRKRKTPVKKPKPIKYKDITTPPPAKKTKPTPVATPRAKTTIDTKNLKVGDILSMHMNARVISINGGKATCYDVENDIELTYGLSLMEKQSTSATQYDTEVTLPITKIEDIIREARDTVLTIAFKKKLYPKDVIECFESDAYKAATTVKARNKIITKRMEGGEDRTLIGRLNYNIPDQLGHIRVYDLEKPVGKNARLVNTSTIQWVILRRVKYIRK